MARESAGRARVARTEEIVSEAKIREFDRGPGPARRQLRRVDAYDLHLADVLNDGPTAPIEKDPPEFSLLCRLDSGRDWRLPHLVILRIAVDAAGARVDLGELEVVLRFDNDVPTKGIPGIRLGGDAVHGVDGDGVIADEIFGLGVFGVAKAPEQKHSA